MADEDGIWLISGLNAWRTGDINCQPHPAVQRLLSSHGVNDLVRLLHSTSWRPIDGAVVLTYIAVLDHQHEPLPSRWPASLAITHAWAMTVYDVAMDEVKPSTWEITKVALYKGRRREP
ncbi:hypothetical protein, partial [Nonomuraea sp. NPDC049784]|uniref:hypothetical protein n=1 Tax=Nonomuraea sp. NPDC049784 TaxID=3154361 RepID=UPI0033E76399